jgi:hypothetical protein
MAHTSVSLDETSYRDTSEHVGISPGGTEHGLGEHGEQEHGRDPAVPQNRAQTVNRAFECTYRVHPVVSPADRVSP